VAGPEVSRTLTRLGGSNSPPSDARQHELWRPRHWIVIRVRSRADTWGETLIRIYKPLPAGSRAVQRRPVSTKLVPEAGKFH